jgi:orotidine-5'-phosphate decarboxylase
VQDSQKLDDVLDKSNTVNAYVTVLAEVGTDIVTAHLAVADLHS